MSNVDEAIATMSNRLDTMMAMLQIIVDKAVTTENTLLGIAQRVTVLESNNVVSTSPSSPSSADLVPSAALPVLPVVPVPIDLPVVASAPAAAPAAALAAVPAAVSLSVLPPLPSTPAVTAQAPVHTPAPATSIRAALAALNAVTARKAALAHVDLSDEEGSIELFDPGISITSSNYMDDSQYFPVNSRQSLLMREQDSAVKRAKEVQYTRAAPPFDEAKLTRLTPRKVLQFWVAVLEYQTCHLLKLNVASFISQAVKDSIVARYPELLPDKINHLTDIQLQNYTIKMIQPRTQAEFYRKMTASVRFNDDTELKPRGEHYGLFYTALLSYKVTFTRMYDILSRDNPHAVPECTLHPGGLLKLFLSKIPHGYGFNVHNNMAVKKFDDVLLYITEFYKSVQRHYGYYLNTAELNDCFIATAADVTTKPQRLAVPAEEVIYN